MPKPKFIYFDIGGVLLRFYHISDLVAREIGVDPKAFKDFLAEFELARCSGQMTEVEIEQELITRFQLHKMQPGFWSKCQWVERFEPILEMHQLATELQSKYRLGILSNASKEIAQHKLATSFPNPFPGHEFEIKIFSYEVGLAKPQPEIYTHAQTLAGAAAAEILFIDDLPINLAAAKAAGWQTFLFNPDLAPEKVAELRQWLL